MRRFVKTAALLYSLLHAVKTGVLQPIANFDGDFLASFPAWKIASLTGRLDLYAGSLAAKWGPPPVWYYGPLEHLLALPIMAFPTLRAGYLAWLAVCLLFVVVTAILAARVVDDAFVVLLVFCNFNPLYEALTQRTIELFELMLLFAAYLFYRRGRDAACGAAIGLAAMAKFLPLIFLPWLVLKRRWRALGAALAVIVPVAAVAQLVLGWQNNATFRQLREGSFLDCELNQSVSGAVVRFAAWTGAAISVPWVSRLLIAAGFAAVALLLFRARRVDGAEDLEFGLLAAAMILLLPHNQNYYLVFLLFPYLAMYARARGQWTWRTALLASSFALVAMPIPLSIVQRLTGVDVFRLYLQAAIPFVGAALLVVALVAEIGMSCAASALEQSPCPSKTPSQISALS